eukprot:gene7800-10595_t
MDANGHPVIDIVLPTYRMEADEEERFYQSKAKAIGDKIIADELTNANYDEEEAKIWSLNISDKIREALHESLGKNQRYKIVVQTTIGQWRDQGIRVASRCLWNPDSDNYASCQFSNATLFCCVLIFALYTD